MALGNNAKASEDSLAIGFGATSSAPNAQAFGNGAVATSGGDISIGNPLAWDQMQKGPM